MSPGRQGSCSLPTSGPRDSDLLIPWNYTELSRDSVGAQPLDRLGALSSSNGLVCARSVTMRGGRTQGAPLRRTLGWRIGQTPVGGHRPPQVNQRSTPAQSFSTFRTLPPGRIRRSEPASIKAAGREACATKRRVWGPDALSLGHRRSRRPSPARGTRLNLQGAVETADFADLRR